jgi:hypothetical protein
VEISRAKAKWQEQYVQNSRYENVGVQVGASAKGYEDVGEFRWRKQVAPVQPSNLQHGSFPLRIGGLGCKTQKKILACRSG